MSNIDKLPHKDASPEIKNDTHGLGSQVSALWQDAYENRGAIAAVALGAAVTGASFAAQHTVLGRILGLSRNTLVIEDASILSHCIKRSLASQGEKVTILKGIESLKPFVGILENGSTRAINLRKFRAAFVDGDLDGKLRGPDIVPALREKKVFTVAMSTETEVNDKMISLGANLGAQKPVVMQMLQQDRLRVPQAIKEPARAQADLDNLRKHFQDPDQVKYRKEMEKQMMKEYLQEEAAAAAQKAAMPAAKTAAVDSRF
jgi:hypothetical protein